mgnify:CR=1 FL=1
MNTLCTMNNGIEGGLVQMTDEQAQATTGGWGTFYVTTSFEFVNINQSDSVAVNINQSDRVAVNINQSDSWA